MGPTFGSYFSKPASGGAGAVKVLPQSLQRSFSNVSVKAGAAYAAGLGLVSWEDGT